jgi:hypothetical protein
MKKVWKILLTTFGLIGLALILHFVPFGNIKSNLFFFQKNCTLTVNSRNGEARIYINGKEYGTTPQSVTNLSEGSYTVELERIAEEENIYTKQTFSLELHRNTEAVINIEIAPGNYKSGHVLYYTPMPQMATRMGAITVSSDVKNHNVWINNERISQDELILHQLNPDEYDIKIDGNGYESIEFPVIVREGYNLNIVAYLLPIPLAF